jgi:hypothetical protein
LIKIKADASMNETRLWRENLDAPKALSQLASELIAAGIGASLEAMNGSTSFGSAGRP